MDVLIEEIILQPVPDFNGSVFVGFVKFWLGFVAVLAFFVGFVEVLSFFLGDSPSVGSCYPDLLATIAFQYFLFPLSQ